MSQRVDGIRSILSHPRVYDFLQGIMGAGGVRDYLVANLIRPASGMRILDIGCGTGQIVEHLGAVEYYGFDDNNRYIDYAQKKYRGKYHFFCKNVNDAVLADLPTIDVVIAAGVLHHLDDSEVVLLFNLAKKSIERACGRFVTFDPCFASDQSRLSNFLVKQDRGLNVRTADEYQRLARIVFKHVSGHVVHSRWVPYTRHYMECA